MTETIPDWTKCPWCGADARRQWTEVRNPEAGLFVDWDCGSLKRGRIPHRVENCQINELEGEVEQLKAIVDKLREAAMDVISLRHTGVCQDARNVAFEELEAAAEAAAKPGKEETDA